MDKKVLQSEEVSEWEGKDGERRGNEGMIKVKKDGRRKRVGEE